MCLEYNGYVNLTVQLRTAVITDAERGDNYVENVIEDNGQSINIVDYDSIKIINN